MKTEFKLSKSLDWVKITAKSGMLEFDCPKCLHNNSVNMSIFNTKTHQDSDELQLTDQKFGYTDKGLVILANVIAFGITVLILFGFLGELMSSNLTYVLGIPIMMVLARIIIPLFRNTFPVWLIKCNDCGEWIILASNGEEAHLARDMAAEKNSKQDTAATEQEQRSISSTNEAAIWDLKNGNKKAKINAAIDLLEWQDPNAVEIILEQALKEEHDSENKSIFYSSVKSDLLMHLLIYHVKKKIKPINSENAYIKALFSRDEIVINHAVNRLGEIASTQAVQPLEKLISEGTYSDTEQIEKCNTSYPVG